MDNAKSTNNDGSEQLDDKYNNYSAGYRRREGDSLSEYLAETLLLLSVEKGRFEDLEGQDFSLLDTGTVRLAKSYIRQQRYLFVAATTLVTRAAIRGGMDDYAAYNLSDKYIYKMDLLNNYEDFHILGGDMIRDFAKSVHICKNRPRYSTPVSRAVRFITDNLHQKIDLTAAAAFAGVSSDYLSKRFSKETGKTFSRFLLSAKIEESKDSLKFTDLSILEISSALAFCSQSYYGKVFYQLTDMTPNEYRQKYHVKR